jgi:tetratricopeptide (TPR) repeat protein
MTGPTARFLSRLATLWSPLPADAEVLAHRRIALVYPHLILKEPRQAELSAALAFFESSPVERTVDDRRAMGTVLARLGRFADALKTYDAVLGERPNDDLAAQNRAVVLVELFRHQEALETLGRLASSRRASKSVLAAYGEALLMTHRDSEAAEVYERALSKWGDDSWLLARLALVSRAQGPGAKAIARLGRLASSGTDFHARLRLVEQLTSAGDLEQAFELSQRLVAANPKHPYVLLADAGCRSRLPGMVDEALADIREAVALAPDDSRLLTQAAALLREVGRADEGIEVADRAHRISPDNPRPLWVMASILQSSDRPVEAIAVLDRAIALDPASPIFRYEKARLLLHIGRAREALAAADAGLGVLPDNLDLANVKTGVLLELGRPQEALELADGLVALDPGNVDALASRAVALHDLGREAEALAGIDAALALSPGNLRSHIARAEILEALGRHAEAAREHAEEHRLRTVSKRRAG